MTNSETSDQSYSQTHPWLSFQFDNGKISPKTWIQLGECAAKCDQMSGVPLKPYVTKDLYLIYLTKGLRATTAIEGNTLSEEEVRKIIVDKSEVPPSKDYLEQEIKNVLKACNQIIEHVRNNVEVLITPEKICEYNSIILENLPLGENVEPGIFRKHRVTVGRYLGPEPKEVPFLVNRLCDWLNGDKFKPTGDINSTVFAIIKSIVAHIYIAWIHPFGDGNGRTARLMEFKILAQSGVPLPAAHLLSDHYNSTRTEYYNQLEKTSKTGGRIDSFMAYAVQGLLDGLNKQLGIIRTQQLEVAMENYIHEMFRDKPGDAWRRRRHLALDMLSATKPVTKDDIPLLSKRLNAEYKDKKTRTILRDLSILHEMGLINIGEEGYVVNIKAIVAFLPLRKQN
jgi:Fic family protein